MDEEGNRPHRFHGDVDEEAQQDYGIGSGDELYQENNDDGEDIIENMDEDYEYIEKLDNYDANDLDEREFSEMSIGARRRAEEQIQKRERQQRKRTSNQHLENRKLPRALKDDSEDSVISDFSRTNRNRFNYDNIYEQQNNDSDDDQFDAKYSDINMIRGKLPEWIEEDSTKRFIRKSFRKFLNNFRDEQNKTVYINKIHEMGANNGMSIEVVFNDLTKDNATIAYWLFETPTLIIPELNRALKDVTQKIFPGYDSIRKDLYVKIKDFPLEEKIRDLRTNHINTLIKVKGVITKRYPVYSTLSEVYYVCRCGDRKGPFYVKESHVDIRSITCHNCQHRGPYTVDSETTLYDGYQKLILQEAPGSVPPGRVPRSKEVELTGDLIDCARPGDMVEVIGCYITRSDQRMSSKHGFPIYATSIFANNVRKVNEIMMTEITSEDRERIIRLGQNPQVFDIIASAIAPSIYGHQNIKTALSLAIFGGTPLHKDDHRVRGDINVLMVGDPGLAKSQFLKYVQSISPRCVYTTGKGASAVGLTAAVQKDPVSNEWTLEGGALVLADQGICLIDEFDKMNEVDRTSIHEAMEQQSISISKAGIVANLQARCSVIAAANPIRGHYDSQITFQDNVNLSDPILSRFDIMCVLKDEIDFTQDSNLAKFIIASHINSHPDKVQNEIRRDQMLDEQMKNGAQGKPNNKDYDEAFFKTEDDRHHISISQSMLKKYILYAKKNFQPVLTPPCAERLKNFYVKLRAQSGMMSGISIMVRHLESLVRFATASAKIHLRNETNERDTDIAINVLLHSFISSTTSAHTRNIEKRFSSELNRTRNTTNLLAFLLNKLVKEQLDYMAIMGENDLHNIRENTKAIKIPKNAFQDKAKELQIFSINDFLSSDVFRANYTLRNDVIIKEI